MHTSVIYQLVTYLSMNATTNILLNSIYYEHLCRKNTDEKCGFHTMIF